VQGRRVILEGSSIQPPAVKFLIDAPAEEDFFGSHSQVAAAIADVIREADSVNIVGLLGSWGSGKSTVVRHVENSLKTNAGPTKAHVFTYDAWLHQNDPPRRAFLEALIGDLTTQSLVKKSDWEPRLADLSGRSEETKTTTTRQLSTTGKWIFLSLGLVPVGLGLLDFDLLEKVFGNSPSAWHLWAFRISAALVSAPLLVVLAFYLWWRPWRDLFRGWGFFRAVRSANFWLEHDEVHRGESILALLNNQSIETAENKTRISPEPTAIEFRSVFKDVQRSLVERGTRLVIVIDNLDRLAEADAMQLWATIRSLFLGRDYPNTDMTAPRPPAIILPIDEGAVARMFSIDHGELAHELSSAFIDKTFDVVFHVNEPVMSDWRNFLKDKLEAAFGGTLSNEDIYWATRFVEQRFIKPSESERITPRKLIKLINAIAALMVQWAGRTEFIVVAFYVLRRTEIEADVVAFVRVEHDIEAVVPDWKRQVVALHFGVPSIKAFQVLLHEPLRSAISELDRDEFSRLIQVDGAWTILEEIAANPPTGAKADKPAARFVANAALLINSAAGEGEIPAKRAMESLSQKWTEAEEIGAMRSDLPDVVRCLGTCLPDRLTGAFVSSSTQKLGVAMSGATIDADVVGTFSKTIDAISALAAKGGVKLPTTLVTVSSEALFQLLGLIPRSHLGHIMSDKTAAEISIAIGNALSDEDVSPYLSDAVRALTYNDTVAFKDRKKIDWSAVSDSASLILQAQPSTYHATMAAVDILGLLNASNETAKAQVAHLFGQGRLATLLNETDQRDDVDLMGGIATLMLLTGSDFVGPNSSSWEEAMEEHEGLVRRIDGALTWYRPGHRVMAAINLKPKVPSFAPVIDALIRTEVAQNNSGSITTSYAFANLAALSSIIGEELTAKCLSDLSERVNFWDTLAKLPSDDAYLTAVDRSMSVDSIDKKLLLISIRERLENASEEAWGDAVNKGSTLLSIVQSYKAELARTPLDVDGLKSALMEAMSTIPEADQAMRTRWFSLADLVSKGSRATMLRNLRDSLLAGQKVSDLASLVAVGGDALLVTGKFANDADKTYPSGVGRLVWIGIERF
jgi:energy-coupling factor transporter ATP-binding protein EcfA2